MNVPNALSSGVIDVEVSACMAMSISSEGISSSETSRPVRTVVMARRYSVVKVTTCSDKLIGEVE